MRSLARARGVSVDWALEDLRDYQPEQAAYDLVLAAYLHLLPAGRAAVLGGAVAALARCGTLLVVGHDLANRTAGSWGPPTPSVRLARTPRCCTRRRRLSPSWTGSLCAEPDVSADRSTPWRRRGGGRHAGARHPRLSARRMVVPGRASGGARSERRPPLPQDRDDEADQRDEGGAHGDEPQRPGTGQPARRSGSSPHAAVMEVPEHPHDAAEREDRQSGKRIHPDHDPAERQERQARPAPGQHRPFPGQTGVDVLHVIWARAGVQDRAALTVAHRPGPCETSTSTAAVAATAATSRVRSRGRFEGGSGWPSRRARWFRTHCR